MEKSTERSEAAFRASPFAESQMGNYSSSVHIILSRSPFFTSRHLAETFRLEILCNGRLSWKVANGRFFFRKRNITCEFCCSLTNELGFHDKGTSIMHISVRIEVTGSAIFFL